MQLAGRLQWNKIEHRLFSFITRNWRGQPLLTLAMIVNLIGATTTDAGLKVRCVLDRKNYPKSVRISDEQIRSLRPTPAAIHGEWNYKITPRDRTS